MKKALLILATITLMLPPAVLLAQQSPTPEVKKTAKADDAAKPNTGAGQTMKDSWITTKTKMSLTTDGRTKARHISVETHGGIIMLRGKVSSAAEKTTAEEIARGISSATGVNNALQIVPDDVREAVDKKDDTIETAIRERLLKDTHLKDASINVRSDNSVVTLRGKVQDPKAKSHASDVVRGVPGVRSVRNELAL